MEKYTLIIPFTPYLEHCLKAFDDDSDNFCLTCD